MGTFRADAVAEVGVGMFFQIRFDLVPISFVITNLFAGSADRDKAAQEAHLQTDHFFKWKEVALASFAKKGFGYEFEAMFPDEVYWE